ncbi:MAG: PAS domain-containing protein [Gemmatimonadaceae bacterium]|jgi:PAS domain S-box-containing protein|nr:PAS domain-containing protein [Gemmatimonadaceae bacterium]
MPDAASSTSPGRLIPPLALDGSGGSAGAWAAAALGPLVASDEPAAIISPIGLVRWWAPAAAQASGFEAAEAIGQAFLALCDPRIEGGLGRAIDQALTGTPWHGRGTVRQRSGSRVPVEVIVTPLAVEPGAAAMPLLLVRWRPVPGGGGGGRAAGAPPDVALLAAALDHVSDLVLLTDDVPGDPAAARVLHANEAVERLLGWRPDELAGRDLGVLRGPGTDPATLARLAEAIRERRRAREELLLYTRRGEPVWLDVDVLAATDADGVPRVRWIAAERDLAPRQGQEVALRAREERLRLALNAVLDGVWDWHVPTGYCYFAPRWYAMLGHADHALPPHIDTYLDLLHPHDLGRVERALRDHFEGGETTFELEVRLRTADHQWRWVLTRGTVVERDASGRPVRMVGTNSDIDKRKSAEVALRESEERFRTLATASPLGIFLADAAGQLTFATARLQELWATDLDALLGDGFLARVHPDDRAQLRTAWGAAVGTGGELSAEFRIVHPDGAERWMWERTAPTHDAAGAVIGHVGTVEDITVVKQAEAARRALEQQMQHAQKFESLGVLAGGIAHDFNNLLVGILGNASIARAEVEAGDATALGDLLEDIETAARRAADLTNQLLAYAGKGRFRAEPLHLSALVREMSALLQSLVAKDTHLVLELLPSLPVVMGDATQLRQVVVNLLSNASEALGDHEGTVTLRTAVEECDAATLATAMGDEGLRPGRYVVLEVRDTGVGMDAVTLGRLFDPFFTTKFTGRGLGMAATLGIVRSHHGAMQVTSAPGQGTTVRVLFPPGRALGVDDDAARPAIAPSGGVVLVVDDEAPVRDVARRMLERRGWRVLVAADGREALEVHAQHRDVISAVILDVTMPRLSGDGVLAEWRRAGVSVPVVLASGYSAQSVAPMIDGPDAPVFVQKPFVQAELLAALDQALARAAR